jgi:steroid delta-isomerase-like uncharacterized protein
MKNLLPFFILLLLGASCTNDQNTVQQNEAIARSFMTAFSEHDIDGLTALFAEDDCLYEEVATGRQYTTKAAIAQYLDATIAGIPDTRLEVTSIVANSDMAAVEWIWHGTNTVGWENMGIPATGKTLELRGISVMEIVDGKIRRNSDYWDWNSFIRQIGPDEPAG